MGQMDTLGILAILAFQFSSGSDLVVLWYPLW